MRLLFSFLLLISFGISNAQNSTSYIYLEGLKSMPYKVTLNGIEVAQLGRNYVLMPSSKEGENVLEIKFGGDLHPTQQFVIDVRNQSSYGYKLAKASEDKFYLLDLVNNGKIIESNSNVNIGLSTENNSIHFAEKNMAIATTNKEKQHVEKVSKEEHRVKIQKKAEENLKAKNAKAKEEKQKAKQLKLEQTKLAKEQEILKVENVRKEKLAKETKEQELGVVEVISAKTQPNQNNNEAKCVKKASDVEIASFGEKIKLKTDDEAKLILVKKKIFTGCISVNQLLYLSELLDTQYGRFSTVKFLHPELSDPENIEKLESLFRYDSYKSKLRKL